MYFLIIVCQMADSMAMVSHECVYLQSNIRINMFTHTHTRAHILVHSIEVFGIDKLKLGSA